MKKLALNVNGIQEMSVNEMKQLKGGFFPAIVAVTGLLFGLSTGITVAVIVRDNS